MLKPQRHPQPCWGGLRDHPVRLGGWCKKGLLVLSPGGGGGAALVGIHHMVPAVTIMDLTAIARDCMSAVLPEEQLAFVHAPEAGGVLQTHGSTKEPMKYGSLLMHGFCPHIYQSQKQTPWLNKKSGTWDGCDALFSLIYYLGAITQPGSDL